MTELPDPLPEGARIVKCPSCGGRSLYHATNPWRPFCCARCKGIDFGDWASESFRMAAEAPPDDIPYGDPKLQ